MGRPIDVATLGRSAGPVTVRAVSRGGWRPGSGSSTVVEARRRRSRWCGDGWAERRERHPLDV